MSCWSDDLLISSYLSSIPSLFVSVPPSASKMSTMPSLSESAKGGVLGGCGGGWTWL